MNLFALKGNLSSAGDFYSKLQEVLGDLFCVVIFFCIKFVLLSFKYKIHVNPTFECYPCAHFCLAARADREAVSIDYLLQDTIMPVGFFILIITQILKDC